MKIAWDEDNLLKYSGSNFGRNILQVKYVQTILTLSYHYSPTVK